MYEILAGMVGQARLKQVDLNVVIFPDWSSYLEYATAVAGRGDGKFRWFLYEC